MQDEIPDGDHPGQFVDSMKPFLMRTLRASEMAVELGRVVQGIEEADISVLTSWFCEDLEYRLPLARPAVRPSDSRTLLANLRTAGILCHH